MEGSIYDNRQKSNTDWSILVRRLEAFLDVFANVAHIGHG